MIKDELNNEYNVILCRHSLLLDLFEKEDHLFAAQCISWVVSIIQFTEILIYYRHYHIFPSDYVKDLVLTPLPCQSPLKEIVPESEIPELDLAEEISIESSEESYIEHLSKKKFPPKKLSCQLSNIMTGSGKVCKPQKIKQKSLAKRYPGKMDKQLQKIWNSLRKDGLIL